MSKTTTPPTLPELVDRARALAPLLRAWAPRHEASRRVSDEAIAAMREAGLFRIMQPAACEGWDMHPRALFEVAREIARADTASGWILCLAGVHPWLLGMFEPRFQDEVFAQGRDAVVPVLSGGVGRGVQVALEDGAIRLSGRWLYASGVDVADWLCVMVPVPGAHGEIEQRLAAVPRSAFAVDEASWQVSSMRGTGSKDVTLTDERVPLYRTISWPDAQRGIYPGAVRNDGPMYRMPLNAVFALCTAMGVVGGAFGLLDAVVELGRKRIANATSVAQADDRYNQIELGQGAAQIHMAYRLILSDVEEMHDQATRGQPFTVEQRARYRADAALASRMALAASTRLVATCGGAILPHGPVQRFFHDMHGMASHFLLQAEVGGELYGKALYGLELPPNTRL